MMKYFSLLVVFALGHAIFPVASQISESVKLPNGGDTCNVINMHCGGGQPQHHREHRTQGSPGKRGVTGPPGPEGPRGDRGLKGEKGSTVNEEALKTDILASIGASSCEELSRNYQVYKSGFYLLKTGSSSELTYVRCDFSATTCSELNAKYGANASGFYFLKSDSWAAEHGVYCNFSNGEGVTEVWHDIMDEMEAPRCEAPGCYAKSPRYKLNQDQILNIIMNSAECKQFIKWRCDGSVINSGGTPFAWWVSRGGEKMGYWGGATSKRRGYCACGETGSCTVANKKCNCDQNNSPITQDEGYLTDKSKLPVSEMRFGDLDAGEYGWHTLGKLECWGKA